MAVHRNSFDVRASDGVLLRGWKVTAAKPNGNWVLVYHGVADNRMGVLEHARMLLLAGYRRRNDGLASPCASEGRWRHTVGWSETTRASSSTRSKAASIPGIYLHWANRWVRHRAAIRGREPRIEAVVASVVRKPSRSFYDYAGLRRYPWLGKTWLSPERGP